MKNRTKHTPGPWTASEYHDESPTGFDVLYEPTEGEGWHEVAMGIRTEADAQLIALVPELWDFVNAVAELTKDGEDVDGEPFDMACDDAVDTLHGLINWARAIVANTD